MSMSLRHPVSAAAPCRRRPRRAGTASFSSSTPAPEMRMAGRSVGAAACAAARAATAHRRAPARQREQLASQQVDSHRVAQSSASVQILSGELGRTPRHGVRRRAAAAPCASAWPRRRRRRRRSCCRTTSVSLMSRIEPSVGAMRNLISRQASRSARRRQARRAGCSSVQTAPMIAAGVLIADAGLVRRAQLRAGERPLVGLRRRPALPACARDRARCLQLLRDLRVVGPRRLVRRRLGVRDPRPP